MSIDKDQSIVDLLKNSELLERTSDAFIRVDANWKILYVNKKMEEVSELKREDQLDKNYLDLFYSNERMKDSTAYRSLNKAMKNREHVYYTDFYEPLSMWGRVNVYPLKLGGLDIYYEDITLKKLNEELVKSQSYMIAQKEQQYKEIFETAHDAFLILDEMGILVEVNPAGCEMHGYTREEMIGLTGKDFVHPDDMQKFIRFVEDVNNGKRFNVSARDIKKDGTIVNIEVVGTPIIFEGENHLLAVLRDVTEREEAKAILESKENELRSLANSIPQLTWVADATGRVHWFNDRWYEYTGTSYDQMQGSGWQNVYHPDHITRVLSLVKAAWKIPKPFELTFPIRRKDGIYRWYLTRAVPLLDHDGKITKWFGTNTDIHESKMNEKKLENIGTDLQIALKSRDEFLSIASHELKTPLTALSLQVEMVEMLLNEKTNHEEILDIVVDAQDQLERLDRLINDLLNITRIKDGKLQLALVECDCLQLVNKSVKALSQLTESKGNKIHVDIPENLTVFWDKNKIEQVLLNLIGNCLKYAAGEEIMISAKKVNDVVELYVEDTGPGISVENQAVIFERFKRATSSRKISGLGLGLYIVRQIAQLHGGDISVESEFGHGTKFILSLPVNHSSK